MKEKLIKKQKNSKLLERIEIDGTPFVAIRPEGERIFLTMGKYRMTEERWDTIDDCKKWINDNTWTLVATFVAIVTEATIEQIKN